MLDNTGRAVVISARFSGIIAAQLDQNAETKGIPQSLDESNTESERCPSQFQIMKSTCLECLEAGFDTNAER